MRQTYHYKGEHQIMWNKAIFVPFSLLALSLTTTAFGEVKLRINIDCDQCRMEPYRDYQVAGATCKIGLIGPGGVRYAAAETIHYQRSEMVYCENWRDYLHYHNQIRFTQADLQLEEEYFLEFNVLEDGCEDDGWNCFTKHTFTLSGWDSDIAGDRNIIYRAHSPLSVLDFQKLLQKIEPAVLRRVDDEISGH